MDWTRRTILAAGAAAVATAAVPRVFAQQSGKRGTGKFYERGPVRIYYEEAGSGFPLLLLPGGGLNSTISFFTGNSPFDAIEEFKGEYRCITADLRNAPSGQSTGPVEVDRPWESYADDQLGLMDHLGIDKFMVMGFCIGGPFIWSLLQRAPSRVVAAVLAQPVGWRPEMRDPKYPGVFWKTWGPALTARRPEISMATVDKFVTRMFETDPDFVFTVTRDFVRGCQTPILVLPDDVPAHPYAVAMESAMLTLMDQILLRKLPVKDPDRLVMLYQQGAHNGSNMGTRMHSYPVYQDLQQRADPLAEVICRRLAPASVSIDNQTERVSAELVSGNYFTTLGVKPAIGRVFSSEEDDRFYGGHPVVVLSYDYWVRRFARDPNVIGKKILVNDYPMNIVGVSSTEFRGLDPTQSPQIRVPVLMKRVMLPEWTWMRADDRRARWIQAFARLQPGYAVERAAATAVHPDPAVRAHAAGGEG